MARISLHLNIWYIDEFETILDEHYSPHLKHIEQQLSLKKMTLCHSLFCLNMMEIEIMNIKSLK